MDSFFFRVEHDLLRSDSFKTLGGSAIKVYLVIGLYADFGTGWAYPSIRTIARQGGMSRQTVLDAIDELTRAGLLAATKSPGKSTAYKLIKPPAADRPASRKDLRVDPPQASMPAVLDFFGVPPETVPIPLTPPPATVPEFLGVAAQFFGPTGPEAGPKRETGTREDNATIPIPGTSIRLGIDGTLVVAAADLLDLLKGQGIPSRLAEKIVAQRKADSVARVVLNALYLQSQGKLQNGPGYIRAGVESEYELLPQVSARLESRRRELEAEARAQEARVEKLRQEQDRRDEDAAIALVIESLRPQQVEELVRKAVALLPELIVRRNPTLSNPFVRGKVYELAAGDPVS